METIIDYRTRKIYIHEHGYLNVFKPKTANNHGYLRKAEIKREMRGIPRKWGERYKTLFQENLGVNSIR